VIAAGRMSWYVINTDGGWYSYPAYAMSQGRDPDENLLPPDELSLATPGVRSLFQWDNRGFLLTRIQWAWFETAGEGVWSIRIFGLLQWIGLAVLIGLAVYRSGGNAWASGAAAIAALSDSKLIHESLADLRPDIPLAVTAVASLLFLILYIRRRSAVSLGACAVLLALLPLIHTTGVLPAAMLLSCLATFAFIPDDGRFSRSHMLAAALIAGGVLAVFLLRQPILDVLIPSRVPVTLQVSGRHDLPVLLEQVAHRGVGWKVMKEAHRWSGYFAGANFAHLLFLAGGLLLLLWRAWQRRLTSKEQLCLAVGWVVGVLVLTFTDPHFTPTHMIPLIALGYVMAGVGWAMPLCEPDAPRAAARAHARAMMALCVLAALAFALKAAEAASEIYRGTRQHVGGAEVRALLAKAFPATGVTWTVGPTSIWLYAPHGGTPVILDERSDPGIVHSQLWKRVGVLVVDSDFLHYGWENVVRQGVAQRWLTPIGEVGKPGGIYFLEAFRVGHPAAAGAAIRPTGDASSHPAP